MIWRRVILVQTLWACPLVSLGCGGYTNDNVPVTVIDEEMLAKMGEEEAERMERYRKIAAEKGWKAPRSVSPDSAPQGIATQKRAEAEEKRRAAAQSRKKK